MNEDLTGASVCAEPDERPGQSNLISMYVVRDPDGVDHTLQFQRTAHYSGLVLPTRAFFGGGFVYAYAYVVIVLSIGVKTFYLGSIVVYFAAFQVLNSTENSCLLLKNNLVLSADQTSSCRHSV